MNIQINPKAQIFVTDKNGTKRYYASHRSALDTVDSKRYETLTDLVDELVGLSPIDNLWTGLSGFSVGAPHIPADETIVAQVAFLGANDIGYGTGDAVVVIVKKQSDPKQQLLVFGGGTPAAFMNNYAF